MSTPETSMRALAAVRGLAYGDAMGEPASLHRTIRDPWVRSMQHRGAEQLDDARVVRTVVPFVLNALDSRTFVATDDTENFAAIATALLRSSSRDAQSVFDAWREMANAADAWVGPAQRSALLNADLGLRPPQTGADNPAFYDDTALPGALACAIVSADPDAAGSLAAEVATISHARVGVQAASVFATVMRAILDGSDAAAAIRSASDSFASGDWLGDGLRDAMIVIDAHPDAFTALPALIDRFAPRIYSHPGTVTETLPLAFAIAVATGGRFAVAVPLAFSVTRHQDSLPALVGALCGAIDPVGVTHIDELDELAGVTIPALAGTRLDALVSELLAS